MNISFFINIYKFLYPWSFFFDQWIFFFDFFEFYFMYNLLLLFF